MARILSCFHDETGEQDMRAGYYMVTMVIHEQAEPLQPYIERYEARLRQAGVDDIPFHMVKLLHGHEGYEGVEPEDRKKMLVAFNAFVRTLPVKYQVFSYTDFDVKDTQALAKKLESDIEAFLKGNLEKFQGYDEVAVYYDGGHKAVRSALRCAFDAALSSGVAHFKKPPYAEKRLYQVADFFCSIELAAMRYEKGEASRTYEKFYGAWRSFRANYLKQARRKRVG